jgi:hypothetical protein
MPHPIRAAIVLAVLSSLLVDDRTTDAGETDDSKSGYIDGAIIRNQLRFRFDAGFDNSFPDRAEFFYAQCGCFPGAPGPPKPETSVDYQELEAYLEYALTSSFSTFVEVPFRIIDPEVNVKANGLGDVRAGFKYALIDDRDRWLTFQLRGYFPTGDGLLGLGTEHFSLEPGVLYQRDFDGVSVFSEFKAWIPFDTSKQSTNTEYDEVVPPGDFQDPLDVDYSGTVARYGIGFSVDLFREEGVIRAQNSRYPDQQNQYPVQSNHYRAQSNRYSLQPGYASQPQSRHPQSPVTYPQNAYQPLQNYDAYQNSGPFEKPRGLSVADSSRLAAVVELVGWTIGGGLKFSPSGGLQDATHDTIVNLKLGLRWNTARDTFYVGYGRALTGDAWYQDIIRAEYAIRF